MNYLFLLLTISLFGSPGYYEPWGTDSTLLHPIKKKEVPQYSLGVELADLMIRFHQEVISPVDGPRSHYRPSSSRYMQLAMYRYGFLKGFVMGCDRLLRENDEKWVYRTVKIDDQFFKYDPACINKTEF